MYTFGEQLGPGGWYRAEFSVFFFIFRSKRERDDKSLRRKRRFVRDIDRD